MSVTVEIRKDSWVSDGTLTPRAIPFPFDDPADIVVTVDWEARTPGVHYTVSGTYPDAQLVPLTGFATNGQAARMRRVTTPLQDYDIAGPALSADALEAVLDRTVMSVQDGLGEASDIGARSLRVREGQSLAAIDKTAFAGKFYGAGVDGELVPLSGTGNDAALRTDLADPAAGGGIVAVDELRMDYPIGSSAAVLVNLRAGKRSVLDFLSFSQKTQAMSGTQPSLDMSVALNDAVDQMQGKQLVSPRGARFLLEDTLAVLAALELDFSGSTIYQGTPNIDVIAIGDGTLATRNKLFNGKLISPSVVPVEGLAVCTSGSAVRRNYAAHFPVIGLSVYGRDSLGWKLFDGLHDERVTESDAESLGGLLVQFVNGSGIYAKGDGTTEGRTVDGIYEKPRIFGAFYGIFIDDGCAGMMPNNPIIYGIKAGGAIMRIRMVSGPNGQNVFVNNIDAECTPGASAGVWVESGDNVMLNRGWIGGQPGVPAVLFDTLASGCSSSVNVDVGYVHLKGPHNSILPCDICGDNDAEAPGVLIEGDYSVVAGGTKLRQYRDPLGALQFVGTPLLANIGALSANNNVRDISDLSPFSPSDAPLIAAGTTDQPWSFSAASTIDSSPLHSFIQIAGSTPTVTTIKPHGRGKLLQVQANSAGGVNLDLPSGSFTIANGRIALICCDGNDWQKPS